MMFGMRWDRRARTGESWNGTLGAGVELRKLVEGLRNWEEVQELDWDYRA